MNMNYSTAKTIVFIYRRKLKLTQSRYKEDSEKATSDESSSRSGQASFRPGTQLMEVSSSVGGNPTYGIVKVCSFRARTGADRPIQISLWFCLISINISLPPHSHSPLPLPKSISIAQLQIRVLLHHPQPNFHFKISNTLAGAPTLAETSQVSFSTHLPTFLCEILPKGSFPGMKVLNWICGHRNWRGKIKRKLVNEREEGRGKGRMMEILGKRQEIRW